MLWPGGWRVGHVSSRAPASRSPQRVLLLQVWEATRPRPSSREGEAAGMLGRGRPPRRAAEAGALLPLACVSLHLRLLARRSAPGRARKSKRSAIKKADPGASRDFICMCVSAVMRQRGEIGSVRGTPVKVVRAAASGACPPRLCGRAAPRVFGACTLGLPVLPWRAGAPASALSPAPAGAGLTGQYWESSQTPARGCESRRDLASGLDLAVLGS